MNKNIEELNNIFFKIYSNIHFIILQHNVKIDIKNIEESKFSDNYKLLNIFYKKLNTIKNNNILIQGFIDNNYVEIKEIKQFLLDIKTPQSRSLHDKIFLKIFKFNYYIPLGITHVFEDFIKGITFFSNEIENKKKIPIYHRSASCGDSTENFRKKYLQCYNDDNNYDIKDKKEHIYKCYLERLIYDDMYRNLTLHFPTTLNNQELKQNKSHLFQLSERAKNFNSCFLGININIQIYYDNNFPAILKIDHIKDNKIIKKEIFIKVTYLDDYGNTRYKDRVLYKIIDENNNEETIIQKFNVK